MHCRGYAAIQPGGAIARTRADVRNDRPQGAPFREIRRPIIAFDLYDTGNGCRLQVISEVV